MLKDLDRWIINAMLPEGDGVIEGLMGLWVTIVLIVLTLVTMPLWVVPYLIIKHRRKRGDDNDA